MVHYGIITCSTAQPVWYIIHETLLTMANWRCYISWPLAMIQGWTLSAARTINDLIGQITKVARVPVTPSRLVEHGTQHNTIGSILSTSVSSISSTNHNGMTMTLSEIWLIITYCSSQGPEKSELHNHNWRLLLA